MLHQLMRTSGDIMKTTWFSIARQMLILVLVLHSVNADAQLANGGVLPTLEEIRGLQSLCGGGDAQVAAVSGNVDAAIKNWRNTSAGATVEIAKKNLTAVLNVVGNDPKIRDIQKDYISCVNDSLQKFLDREKNKPTPVSRIGKSSALLRSSFPSDEEIWRTGCKEAEDEAVAKLASYCAPRMFSYLGGTQCPQSYGSPRTYSAKVIGECRSQ
jgi:hypothetical protein